MTSPFTPPSYDDDRGMRRLVANVRKGCIDFENAHNQAQSSGANNDKLLANGLREELIRYHDELILQIPMRSNVSMCASREEVLARVDPLLTRCPSFGEVTSGESETPPLASTIVTSDTVEAAGDATNSQEHFSYPLKIELYRAFWPL